MGAVGTEFIRQQCLFFDHLADLVDPRFYHDDGREPVNLKYMKKAARIATKQAFKEQYKQNKRAKLDPDTAKTTTELQKQKLVRAYGTDSGEDEAGPGPGSVGLGTLHLSSGPAPTRQELLARLQQKLQAARQERHAMEGAAAAKPRSAAEQAKDWRKQALGQQLKQKAGQQAARDGQQQTTGSKRKQQEVDSDGSGQPATGAASAQQKQQQAQKKQKQQQPAAALGFNTLVVPEGHKGHKQKKPTKEQLLQAAEEKQARLAAAAAAAGGGAADATVAAEAWQAALARARGERVLDDPKLLRRSLKKEAQLKAKRAKKWQERVATQQEAQQARQDRRKENLQARSQVKLVKKKERREKKLLRAGFEGRKQGFIRPAAKKL